MRAAGRRAIVLFIYLSFMLIVLCSGERAGGEREGKWEGEGGGAELFLGSLVVAVVVWSCVVRAG